jgi:hypothetical protein
VEDPQDDFACDFTSVKMIMRPVLGPRGNALDWARPARARSSWPPLNLPCAQASEGFRDVVSKFFVLHETWGRSLFFSREAKTRLGRFVHEKRWST